MMLKNKIFSTALAAGLLSVSATASAAGIGDMFATLGDNLKAIVSFFDILAILLGTGMLIGSVMMGISAAKPNSQTTWTWPIALFIGGSIMLGLGAVAAAGRESVGADGGDSLESFLSEAPSEDYIIEIKPTNKA